MDLKMLVLHQYVVGNYLFQFLHLLGAVHLDVQQILDEQNLVVLLPFLDVVHLVVVLVGVELRRQLRMDYFLDVVGVELLHLQRTDYFLDVVQQELPVLHLVWELFQPQLLHLLQLLLLLVQPFQHRVMP
jgi:hypothetical protein